MDRSIREIEEVLRNRICGVCSERTVDGTCGLEEPAECTLFALLPQVAQAVKSTHSDDIADYISAIRQDVCSVCRQGAADGSCESRAQVRCALDAYLLLVVEAIEEATGKRFDRAGLSGPLLGPESPFNIRSGGRI